MFASGVVCTFTEENTVTTLEVAFSEVFDKHPFKIYVVVMNLTHIHMETCCLCCLCCISVLVLPCCSCSLWQFCFGHWPCQLSKCPHLYSHLVQCPSFINSASYLLFLNYAKHRSKELMYFLPLVICSAVNCDCSHLEDVFFPRSFSWM